MSSIKLSFRFGFAFSTIVLSIFFNQAACMIHVEVSTAFIHKTKRLIFLITYRYDRKAKLESLAL